MPYSTEQYLLDRAHIQDTLTRLYLFFDTRQLQKLPTHVLAPEVTFDYTTLFGTPPKPQTAAEQTQAWEGFVQRLETSQHIIVGIVPELPAPGPTISPPDTAEAVANAHVYLQRSVDGVQRSARNGGSVSAELVRIADADLVALTNGNPWRLKVFRTGERPWNQGMKELWA